MDDDALARLIEEALQDARDQHVEEVTIVYHGKRYPASELRRLSDAGRLDTLPPKLAVGVPGFLQNLDLAERLGEKRLSLLLGTGDGGWIAFLPLSCDFLTPPGWEIYAKAYRFAEEDDDDED